MPQPFTIDFTNDGHIHTSLCRHAVGEMSEYVKAAIDKGLAGITFLEHIEVNIHGKQRTWLAEDDIDTYFHHGNLLKKKYQGRLEIQLGAELGYSPDGVPALKRIIDRYPWENIGLSYHFLPHNDQHVNMMSRDKVQLTVLEEIGFSEVATKYFTGLLQALNHISCDKICHLDAVLRHAPTFQLSRQHYLLIDRILTRMQEKGTALEVNTSGFSLRNHPFPCAPILKKAMDLGLPLVIGSDAHNPDQVGRFFTGIQDYLCRASCTL